MSSIAGPSSHAFSSFPIGPKHPPAISTNVRHLQDGPEQPSGAATPATPVMTTGTAPTTAPPTPVVRSSSHATDAREMSVDIGGNANGSTMNGTGEMGPPQERRRDLKESVVADLDAVRARTIALGMKHGRGQDDTDAMVQTAARIAARLAEDQRAALFPDVDEPFTDEVDVVNRLLPFHVFQQPKEDLDVLVRYGNPLTWRKGKRKATEEDMLREEIADTKFALQCWRRKRALERRFRNARMNSGKRPAPDDQAYVLAQAILEVERAENVALTAELRAARAELDKIEREKRAAAPPPSTPKPTPTVRTTSSSTYYSSSTTSTPTTATFMPPYRPPYSYSYSQYPSTQYSYNPYSAYTPTTSTPYGSTTSQAPSTPTTTYTPPSSTTSATPTSAASAQVQQAQAQPTSVISNTAIPVQLPVSSLPALATLGIIPVAAASVPPAGQAQPPAVIKSTNGNMLSLEINLSLLQSAQMSGLVLILNALTSRGVNVDGSTTALAGSSTTTAPSGSTQGLNGIASSGTVGTSTAASSVSAAAAGLSSTSAGSTSPAGPSVL